ncbi:hypothetical protein HMPREF1425_00407 [Helicobacter pylori GAM71Ai]|nr:hypothetical protein HMPREF1425_00407 [Helicobacter pylori GAM71Ai]
MLKAWSILFYQISTSFKTSKTCSKNSTKFVCARKIITNPLY